MALYRLEEWESNGKWYCEHTSTHPAGIVIWVIPARLLDIPADEFIKWLIKNYNPDCIFHNEDCSFVGWAWKDQSTMRKFKNYINKLSREKNFQI